MSTAFSHDYSLNRSMSLPQILQVIAGLRADIQDWLAQSQGKDAAPFFAAAGRFIDDFHAYTAQTGNIPVGWELEHLQAQDRNIVLHYAYVYLNFLLTEFSGRLHEAEDIATYQFPAFNLQLILKAMQAIAAFAQNTAFPCFPGLDLAAFQTTRQRCADALAAQSPAMTYNKTAMRNLLADITQQDRLLQTYLSAQAQSLALTSFDLNLQAIHAAHGPIYRRLFITDDSSMARILANYRIMLKILPAMTDREDIIFYFSADVVGWLIDLESILGEAAGGQDQTAG